MQYSKCGGKKLIRPYEDFRAATKTRPLNLINVYACIVKIRNIQMDSFWEKENTTL